MRFRKGKEPIGLRRWRAENPSETSWKALDAHVVAQMRESLARDQRGACCYCYGPTTVGSRIEHIEARTGDNIFAWDNLALACSGAEGLESDDHHCDKRKGNRVLRVVHPYSNPVVHLVRVTLGGRLKGHAEDEALHEDIEETLNLNGRRPLGARQEAIAAALAELPKDRRWSARRVATLLAGLRDRNEPIPYQAWVEQWLASKLASR
jgi:uncharacterized protein (TIGR02646 family)